MTSTAQNGYAQNTKQFIFDENHRQQMWEKLYKEQF